MILFLKRNDAGKRRGFFFESFKKCTKPVVSGGGSYNHPVAGVADGAGNAETRGQVVDKGSKSHSLDSATDKDFDPGLIRLFYV